MSYPVYIPLSFVPYMLANYENISCSLRNILFFTINGQPLLMVDRSKKGTLVFVAHVISFTFHFCGQKAFLYLGCHFNQVQCYTIWQLLYISAVYPIKSSCCLQTRSHVWDEQCGDDIKYRQGSVLYAQAMLHYSFIELFFVMFKHGVKWLQTIYQVVTFILVILLSNHHNSVKIKFPIF